MSNSDRWWCKQLEQSSTSCTWADVVTIKKFKHCSSYDLPPDTAGYRDYRDLRTFSVLIFLGLDTLSLSWNVSCVSKHVWGMQSSAFSVDSADNLFGKQSMSRAGSWSRLGLMSLGWGDDVMGSYRNLPIRNAAVCVEEASDPGDKLALCPLGSLGFSLHCTLWGGLALCLCSVHDACAEGLVCAVFTEVSRVPSGHLTLWATRSPRPKRSARGPSCHLVPHMPRGPSGQLVTCAVKGLRALVVSLCSMCQSVRGP